MTEASEVELSSPRLRRTHSLWVAKRQPDRLPSQGDLDIFTFPGLLPWIILHDVIDVGGQRRFRIRVEGIEVAKMFGSHRSGKLLEEVFTPEDAKRIHRAYDTVAETRQLRNWRTYATLPSGEVLHYTRLLMPLSSDGSTVDRLFGMLEFERLERTARTASVR